MKKNGSRPVRISAGDRRKALKDAGWRQVFKSVAGQTVEQWWAPKSAGEDAKHPFSLFSGYKWIGKIKQKIAEQVIRERSTKKETQGDPPEHAAP